MKLILLFFTLLFSLNIYAQQNTKTNKKTDTIENFDNQVRFFGIDYKITSPQTPISEKYNQNGIKTTFVSFNADLSYAWYLDKKKQNSILLSKVSYSNLKMKSNIDDTEKQRISAEIPEYIYKIPTIHDFGLNILFIQKFARNWDFTASYDMIVSSDFESFILKDDFNSVGLFYFQKKIGNFKLGAGSAIYIINKKVKAFPIVSIEFSNKKMNMELLPPLSLDANLRTGRKTILNFGADLIISGFNIDYKGTNPLGVQNPDYVNNSGFDISLSFDRQLYKTLRCRIGTGYSYREVEYLNKTVLIDKTIFQDGLFLELTFYSTF